MPTPNELVRRVEKYVKDLSYDNDILELINEAIVTIDKSENPLILRPSLETSDDVATVAYDSTTPVNYVSLPTNYGKHLFAVESEQQKTYLNNYVPVQPRGVDTTFSKPEINILDNMRFMLQKWGRLDQSGPVEDVLPLNELLYYVRIPTTSDTLTLHFYMTMSQITNGDNSELTELPSHLQYDLLASYAAQKIFFIKNYERQAQIHMTLFEAALKKLAKENKHSSRQQTWRRESVGMI
jgi:hypothetical protein